MVSGQKVPFDSKGGAEFFHEFRGKLRSSVADNPFGDSMELPDFLFVYFSCVEVGIRWIILENQSTMTKIASSPFEFGSGPII